MGVLVMEKKKSEDIDLEIYNEEQLFWMNVKQNTEASIERAKAGIKLSEKILIMADREIVDLSTK